MLEVAGQQSVQFLLLRAERCAVREEGFWWKTDTAAAAEEEKKQKMSNDGEVLVAHSSHSNEMERKKTVIESDIVGASRMCKAAAG